MYHVIQQLDNGISILTDRLNLTSGILSADSMVVLTNGSDMLVECLCRLQHLVGHLVQKSCPRSQLCADTVLMMPTYDSRMTFIIRA